MRFGVVGGGVIFKNHANAVNANERAELVAVCDIIEDKAREAMEKYGAGAFYTDYREMVKDKGIDVVCICTPSGTHMEIAVEAAKEGKHVLCEKPLDITVERMDTMIKACRDNGVKLGCVFQRRIMPEAIETKKAIQEGKLGKLVLADAYLKYYRSQEYYDSAGWRGTWKLDGGGALMNQGVHGIDLIEWMAGDVESVFARAGALVRDIEVEDTCVMTLRYKNGAYGVIEGTTSVYPAQDTRFELHGEKGSIIFGDGGIKLWKTLDENEKVPELKNEKVGGSADPKDISSRGHFILVDDMISAIIEDREPMIRGESASKSVKLILAAYESAKTGKEVFL
jgi:UDP-N-acetyl-2-amino-2-deoxyglucuronate dehydrogenase